MDKKVELVKKTLEQIFSFLGIDPDFTIDDEEENFLEVKIWNEDLSFLIGYRGNCLKALKYYLGLIVNKDSPQDSRIRIILDIDDYMEKRRDKVEEITRNYIDKVRFFNKEVHMPNMDSAERFMVHTYVGNYPDIVSESEGEGFARHVVLKPALEKSKEDSKK